jgi:hypothetical protein
VRMCVHVVFARARPRVAFARVRQCACVFACF